MTEGITYNPIGTVDITFDDKTYHLGRPKMRQFKYFTQKLADATKTVAEQLGDLQAQITAATEKYRDAEDTPEAKEELGRLEQEVSAFSARPFYEYTGPILAEMFDQLGDAPLPDDRDEWPAWLAADSTVPGEILKHWRQNPKASGATPPN